MDKDKLKELTEKFMSNFPVEFTALRGQDHWDYHDIDMFHSYACHTGIDCFDFHRQEVKEEMPSLFLIPFERKLINPRGSQFIQMGKDAGVLADEKPDSKYAVAYIGCKFTTTLSKNLAVKVISGMLDDFNAKYYAFISEAWCVKANGKNVPIKELEVAPSEHPDREEILMINTSGIDNTTIMTTKPIREKVLIHSEGKRVQTNGEDMKEQGRFSNLFREIRAESKPN
jgi:hypothetical protein|tara:strand:- start:86 stop:769 length:684 start_codon:yes stop_codon:yes gene_type:complete